MEKGMYTDAEGMLHTDAEAVIFVACDIGKSVSGREYQKIRLAMVQGNEVETAGRRCWSIAHGVRAMEKAMETLVFKFCRRKDLKCVDIVYELDEDVFSDKDIYGYYKLQQSSNGMRTAYVISDDVKVRLHRKDTSEIDTERLLNAIYKGCDKKWLQEQEKVELFLAIVKKLAEWNQETDEPVYSFENLRWIVQEAACQNPIQVQPRGSAADEYDEYESDDEYDADDECDGYDESDDVYDADDEVDVYDAYENDDENDNNEDSKRRQSLIDLLYKYAKSIKKNKMTSFHLLYGFACISLMKVEDICKELGADEEGYARISYLQGRMKGLYNQEPMEIDSVKHKLLIPMYVDYFENDTYAVDDYKTADTFIKNELRIGKLATDTILLAVLNDLLFNTKDYNAATHNNFYFRKNKMFMLEKKKDVMKASEGMEEIVKTAGNLQQVLTEKLVGQDMAIQKFIKGYVNGRLAGQGRKDKPAASYLFAGPPGVGKTYLARLFADTLGLPFKIFDMSQYAGHNAADGLVGFEKTWKASTPGVLTSSVSDNPKSVLLVDEIEKAHLTVQMLFLQILEGARLYDKYYEKYVSFEHVIIIFTTNCGQSLYQDNEDADLSELSEGEVLDALREDESFPNELCSRFASGSIILFNHLTRYYLCDIVRRRMDAAAKEMAEYYQLQLTYDELLPELFLFSLGGGIDARIASARGPELLKDCMLSFVRDDIDKHNAITVDTVSVEIELDRENREVYPLFVNEQGSKILVISDSKRLRLAQEEMQLFFAENAAEALQLLREHKFALVLIDLLYQAQTGHAEVSNALGIDSVGKSCLTMVQKKAPQLPVYVVNHASYHTEDRKEILSAGVRGLFTEGEDEQACTANIRKLVQQLYILNNLKCLSEKGQCIDYELRYFVRENRGIVQFYQLCLRSVGVDDAALRRKAKSSKVFDFERPKLRFADIIGAEQAKRDFRHFIKYMHNMETYVLEGAEVPRGVLLYGPPGTGKTSLAKALAGECEALFLNTTGAAIRNAQNPVQEIKDLFKIAYANAPAILFIDEIDVIAKARTGYDTQLEMLVNTLLTEMEGFADKDPFKPVFVVAATNYNITRSSSDSYEVVIDPALVRRFDNPVYVGLPSREERKKYVQLLLKQKNYADKISEAAVDYVAEHTGGKSLAFLKRVISNMTNAAIDMDKEISDDLLTELLETQLYGEKRENDDEYRLSVARHEAGHAYVGFRTGREPKFITIVSRGNFGGYVSYGDGEDIHNLTKEDFLNTICRLLAGRAAEMLYYGEGGINTGASSDLKQATNSVIQMIGQFGMGSMGLLSLDTQSILDSPKGAEVLEEANRILEEQLARAMRYVREGQAVIDRVTAVLMDKSYIQGESLVSILEEGEQLAASQTPAAKPHKWYVVINGRKPGIYVSWAECAAQVKGYRNAIYRSYKTEEEAKQAFLSARIGTKNIRDKKLLYHLVKLEDMAQILKEGLTAQEQIGEKKYVSFAFHAYDSFAVRKQRQNPDTAYVYVCVTREYAAAQGYRIITGQPQDGALHTYSYAEGISRIDWKALEAQADEEMEVIARCVTESKVTYEELAYIYLPDEKCAARLKELCEKAGVMSKGSTVITVNKRMFI